MKRILLASAAIVGFAGAAAAEVGISGSATIGWNDEFKDGFYNDLDFDVNFTQELNYGLTAAASIGFEYVDSAGDTINNGTTDFGDFTDDNFLLSLTADMGGLYFGNTDFAAQTYWSGVTNMAFDSFSEADGETVLRGEVMFGDITAGVSYAVVNEDFFVPADETITQLSVGATGSFGAFNFSAAYQEESDVAPLLDDEGEQINGDFRQDATFGIAVGTSFAGADLTVAYSDQDGDGTSTGIEVAYPFGPVSVTAFYVMNDADDDFGADVDDNYGIEVDYVSGPIAVSARYHDGDDEEFGVEGSYDVGNGLIVYAGYIDERENRAGAQQAEIFYVAGQLDLGNGASVLLSYAEVDEGEGGVDTALDEIGANDYLEGTTLAVSLDF